MMTSSEDPRISRACIRISKACALAVILMGLAVLAGWILGIPILKSGFPGLVTMKFNAAIGFSASGLGLYLLLPETVSRRRRILGRALAVFVFAIGFITLLQYLAGLDLRIDGLFVHDDMNPINTGHPGRMAPATALGFVAAGLSLLFLSKYWRGSHWFATSGIVLGLMAALGYVFGAESLYGFRHFTAMAIHTALAFILLNISVLLARPRMGYVDTLASDSLGGFVARRLLAFIPACLICIGVGCKYGARQGWYDDNFQLALMVLFGILVATSLALRVAGDLKKMDLKRRAADDQINELNAKLESRIKDRTAELQHALDNIRRLEGFLPICAWCKNIRDDKNYWTSVEDYVSQRTDAHFSHGICPDCLAREKSVLGSIAD